MEIGWILGGLFIFCTMVFLAFALFMPEWVGIQGAKAREIEESQRETSGTSEPQNSSEKG